MNALPDFRDPAMLRAHIASIMAFYHPRAIDPQGGFFQYFKDDGRVYDTRHRHLVSSTRFVFDYAMAASAFGRAEYLDAARHGLRYLRDVHRDPRSGGYAWTIGDGRPDDRTQHAYGAAFVLLAYAISLTAGIAEAAEWIEETWRLLEERYWDPDAGLYRDEASPDWVFTSYRGQNANMHLCEALIAAFEATDNLRYLDRAVLVADHITRRQAAPGGGLVWEHYDAGWQIDWDYHRDQPQDLFRPWGFQPGHQTEWAKLLLKLEPYCGADWMLPVARHLFDNAVAAAWDREHGGFFYGFAPDRTICDRDKYYWVQAETLAAAAHLAVRTGEPAYAGWYEQIWAYCWRHFVDHEHGAWYRILDERNRKYSDEKSPAGKTDYHTMGACYEVLPLVERLPAAPAPGGSR